MKLSPATQYFIGQFDRNSSSAIDNKVKWLDYGPDEYAGVTWGNTSDRNFFRMGKQLAKCEPSSERKNG